MAPDTLGYAGMKAELNELSLSGVHSRLMALLERSEQLANQAESHANRLCGPLPPNDKAKPTAVPNGGIIDELNTTANRIHDQFDRVMQANGRINNAL